MKNKKLVKPTLAVLDKYWRKAAVAMWGDKCEVCGSTSINVHHVVTRSNRATRWDIGNACILCPLHHTFSTKFSAHGTGILFAEWLRDRRGDLWFAGIKYKANLIKKWTPAELVELKGQLKAIAES